MSSASAATCARASIEYGFKKTLSVLDEWNYGLIDPMPGDLQRAGFITSALIYMQDAPIDVSALYRADNVFGTNGTTPDKTGQALIALGRMKDTPLQPRRGRRRLDGFAVQAGRSKNGEDAAGADQQLPDSGGRSRAAQRAERAERSARVFDVKLLERRSVTYRNNAGYDVTIDNLAGNRTYTRRTLSHFRDQTTSPFRIRTEQRGPSIRLYAALPPPAHRAHGSEEAVARSRATRVAAQFIATALSS